LTASSGLSGLDHLTASTSPAASARAVYATMSARMSTSMAACETCLGSLQKALGPPALSSISWKRRQRKAHTKANSAVTVAQNGAEGEIGQIETGSKATTTTIKTKGSEAATT
jgi:hypothetical protein